MEIITKVRENTKLLKLLLCNEFFKLYYTNTLYFFVFRTLQFFSLRSSKIPMLKCIMAATHDRHDITLNNQTLINWILTSLILSPSEINFTQASFANRNLIRTVSIAKRNEVSLSWKRIFRNTFFPVRITFSESSNRIRD